MHSRFNTLLLICSIVFLSSCSSSAPKEAAKLRLEVFLTPQELETFEPALTALDTAHPEWDVTLETGPQSGTAEKINTQLAGNDLPDVIRVQGLLVQQWIRRGAFIEVSPYLDQNKVDLTDFYPGPLDQFRWNGKLYGIPDTAAPDVVFYNKTMFDTAGVAYPTDEWTYDDMRKAAIQLTLDNQGRNPTDPDFDPQNIQQWGWNGGLTMFWQRHLVQGFGGDFCASEDCTTMKFTDPATVQAAEWWSQLVSKDHAALYDPYGGSQTGVPGDPFLAGKAAMGYNGFFAVGQLNQAGTIQFDIVQPLAGPNGSRHTPLSVTGYVISAKSAHPKEAWALVQTLIDPQFLADNWGKPGHAVPARRSAADSVVNPAHQPANQAAILKAMEYGQVFLPDTASAFEVYGKTADLFVKMMKGELPVPDAMQQIETIANETLAKDREP